MWFAIYLLTTALELHNEGIWWPGCWRQQEQPCDGLAQDRATVLERVLVNIRRCQFLRRSNQVYPLIVSSMAD